MPHVSEHRFGPGQYESLVFKTWVSKVEGSRERVSGRLEGTYSVYCGEGNEHDFDVKEAISYWNGEAKEPDTDAFLLFEIHTFINKVDTIYDLADRLVNYALEDWDDPCEVMEL